MVAAAADARGMILRQYRCGNGGGGDDGDRNRNGSDDGDGGGGGGGDVAATLMQ